MAQDQPEHEPEANDTQKPSRPCSRMFPHALFGTFFQSDHPLLDVVEQTAPFMGHQVSLFRNILAQLGQPGFTESPEYFAEIENRLTQFMKIFITAGRSGVASSLSFAMISSPLVRRRS